MRCVHAMPFGASPADGGGVDFRLWAPAPAQVALALCGADGQVQRVLPARREVDGRWFCHVAEAQVGDLYRWRIDGGLLVPDPASRDNPLGVHEASRVVDPGAFPWDDTGWRGRPWDEVVLYELHVGAFTAEGTYAAAARELPELAALGITAVELMPLASFPGRFGWGYDGVLPFAPHAAYGRPDDLKAFVETAHRLGLMVFVDVVYNHFGPDGNYLGAYAPSFFSSTHQSPWGAALNFDGEGSAGVREFFVHNALYWVEEFQIDGLRLDAVHAITDASTPDILQQISQAVRDATPGRHVHLVLENDRNEGWRLADRPLPGRFDGQWNDDFHHALHVALTGDSSGYFHDYGAQPIELLAHALAHGYVYEGAPRQQAGVRAHCTLSAHQPLGAMVVYANNHDQTGNRAQGERLGQIAPADAGPLPMLLSLLTPATPMLFFGDEFGAATPFLYFADWEGELREAVRAGRAREFGHAPGGDAHALPDPTSPGSIEASRWDRAHRQGELGQQTLALVQQALAARRQWIVPRQRRLCAAAHRAARVGATGIAVQWAYDDGHSLVLRLNLGPEAVAALHGPVAGGRRVAEVFRHRWPQEPEPAQWPAWSACWTLEAEDAA